MGINQESGILREAILERIVQRDRLTEDDIWSNHGPYIFQARQFQGSPTFYPVYRWRDFYSFSPFALLVKKGQLCLHPNVVKYFDQPHGDVSPPNPMADLEIERIGSSPVFTRKIKHASKLAERLAPAIQQDVSRAEDQNLGKTNIILCGGKDSLNLLLLQWKNPVLVVSADPNFVMVEQFVRENGLDFEVRRLEDVCDEVLLNREIAEGFCMVDLQHWKWTKALCDLADEFGREVIFWKGQHGDLFLTDLWRAYTSRIGSVYKFGRRAYRALARSAARPLDAIFAGHAVEDVRVSLWSRGSVMQGSHMGFIRAVTDSLVLSAYHGPAATEILHSADFPCTSSVDMRDLLGRIIFGREVKYPSENRGPEPSRYKRGLYGIEHFREAVQSFGIPVRDIS